MVRSQQGSNYLYTRYDTAFCYQLREKVGLLGSLMGSLPFMYKTENAIIEISLLGVNLILNYTKFFKVQLSGINITCCLRKQERSEAKDCEYHS